MGNFGERLKNIRTEQGLTQEQLSKPCGTSAGVIRQIEKSRRKPSYEMLYTICNALNVAPEYLMQDDLSLKPSDDKEEILAIINQLTPDNIKLLKGLMKTWKSHLASGNENNGI